MKKYEILQLIKDHPDCFVQKIKASNIEFYFEINNLYTGRNFSEKLYQFIYGIPACRWCGSNSNRFVSFIKGYAVYCSKKCSNRATHNERTQNQKDANAHLWEERNCERCNTSFTVQKRSTQRFCGIPCSSKAIANDETRLNTIKKTKNDRYGDVYYTNIEKTKDTNLKRYGVENVFQSEEMQNKIRDNNFKKHGVKYSSQIPNVKEKIKQSNLNNYGVENASKCPEIKERVKTTNQVRYGVDNVFSLETVKSKIKDTNVNKYGVEYPSQSEEIKNKIKNKTHKKIFLQVISRIQKLSNIVPLFNEHNYVTSDRSNKYKFKCNTCENEFLDHVDGGHLPRCLNCNPILSGYSKYEKDLFEFLNSLNIGCEIIENDRNVLNGKELDIYIPEKNIAIEFNGLYWHSESNGNKHKTYHLSKTEECKNKGIHLIQIFEDEWVYKRNIIELKLKHILSNNHNKTLHARKCEIKEIDSKICNPFLNENHIQGECGAKFRYGLYYENKLVSVMTFGELRKPLGKSSELYEYELIRFCSDINVHVVGGASKLLKYFIKHNKVNKIITYADKRYSKLTDNMYIKIGFNYVSETDPTYWYFKLGEYTRYHRYKFAKHNLTKMLDHFDPDLSEWQNMQVNGYDRIWDCGHLKYEMVM